MNRVKEQNHRRSESASGCEARIGVYKQAVHAYSAPEHWPLRAGNRPSHSLKVNQAGAISTTRSVGSLIRYWGESAFSARSSNTRGLRAETPVGISISVNYELQLVERNLPLPFASRSTMYFFVRIAAQNNQGVEDHLPIRDSPHF